MAGRSRRGHGPPAPVPKPTPGTAAPIDTPVCAHCPPLGGARGSRYLGLRHALDAKRTRSDLHEDAQPAGCAAAARPYEAGKLLSAISESRLTKRSAPRSRWSSSRRVWLWSRDARTQPHRSPCCYLPLSGRRVWVKGWRFRSAAPGGGNRPIIQSGMNGDAVCRSGSARSGNAARLEQPGRCGRGYA
jgi:hypothetical protein